jgi:hypothetical protein
MNQRVILRWVHMLLNIPIIGYFYGGVSQIPGITIWIKFFIIPLIVFSGIWMWKGHAILRSLKEPADSAD